MHWGLQLPLGTIGQGAWCWGKGSPCWGQRAGRWAPQREKNCCQKQALDIAPSQVPPLGDSGGDPWPLVPKAKGAGTCCRGHRRQQPCPPHPSCGQVASTAQLPVQCRHLQVCREKWRFSVAGAAAARAEGSAWPSRYWMERSWKQGSASSTAVARSALQRETVRPLT